MSRIWNLRGILLLVTIVLVALLFGHLSYPLLWNDEGETAVFAERVLRYGFPLADDGRNLVYEISAPLEVGIEESSGAYIGSTWGQYYFGALGAWWARQVEDPYAKTLRLRLPFVWVGLVGLALVLACGLRIGRLRTPGAEWFALCFLLLCVASVSLQLHLREMRHYALDVFWVALCVTCWAEREIGANWRPKLSGTILAGALVFLFHTFSFAFFALTCAFAVDLGTRRGRRAWRHSGPLVVAVLLVLPALLAYETLRVNAAVAASLSRDPLSQLTLVIGNLARDEQLVPALVARLVAIFVLRQGRSAPVTGPARARFALSTSIWWIVGFHVLLLLPQRFYFDRYLIALSPLIDLALLLDAAVVLEVARGATAERRRRLRTLSVALGLAALLWLVPERATELRGRFHEIRHRYQGPMDAALPLLRELAPAGELVVATNYEAPVLVYYLDARVRSGPPGSVGDASLTGPPHAVILRPWKKNQAAVADLARGGRYREIRTDVADLPYNNIPQLHATRFVLLPHQFETVRPGAYFGRPFTIHVLEDQDPSGRRTGSR